MMRKTIRNISLIFCLTLSACGFHLRGEALLPANMQRIFVDSSDVYGPLKHDLDLALARSAATVEQAAGAGIAEIKLTAVSLGPVVRSVNSNARVNEFTMLYHVELEIIDSGGAVVMPKTVIEQSRVFTFDQTQAIGTGAEQDIIKQEMERDMAQSILRRIDALAHKGAAH